MPPVVNPALGYSTFPFRCGAFPISPPPSPAFPSKLFAQTSYNPYVCANSIRGCAEFVPFIVETPRARLTPRQPGLEAGRGRARQWLPTLACVGNPRPLPTAVLEIEAQHAEMIKLSKKADQTVRGTAWSSRSMPTMNDVARVTGFSQMTVSRAFLDSSPIRKETRDKILEAAAELGYFHNKTASRLASQRLRAFRNYPSYSARRLSPFVAGAQEVFEKTAQTIPAEHRLCTQARTPGNRTAGVAACQGDPASFDRTYT